MEIRAFRAKVKPDAIERVRAWAAEIKRRRQEAMETLRAETVLLESCFLEHAADGDYMVGIMIAQDFERASAVAASSTHAIDAYHKQFKRESLEPGETLELLVDLNRLHEYAIQNPGRTD
jgi:hypothetical protein